MDEKSLTYKTFKNISYSVIGYVWGLIFAVLVTPIIVFKLGVETYGVYLLVLTVSGLMGLLDIGIGTMLVKYISEYHARGEEGKLKDLMYSFNTLLFVMSIIFLVVMSCVGYWANIFFPSMSVTRGYYFVIFFLQGLIFFVGGLSTLFVVIPVAMQRFETSTKLGVVNMTVSNLSILLLVTAGFGLRAIFLAQLFFSVVFFFAYKNNAKKLLPVAALKFTWKWTEIKNAYKFGLATYASTAANAALTYFDRLLIPVFLGPSALPYYTLPGNVASKTPSVINTLSSIIFPVISRLNGVDDMEKIRNIYKRALHLLMVISFAITISIVLFANKIMLYWLDVDFATRSAGVLVILAFTYFLLSLGGTLNAFLLGLSKTKFLFKISVLMAVVNAILLFILLPKFGIVGAAWAYLLSVLPIFFMFYYVEKKLLGLTGRHVYYFKFILKLIFVSAIFFLLCRWAIVPLVKSLGSIIFFGPLSVLIFLLFYGLFGFYDEDDIRSIRGFVITVFKKINFTRLKV